jgi:hypothetical protein
MMLTFNNTQIRNVNSGGHGGTVPRRSGPQGVRRGNGPRIPGGGRLRLSRGDLKVHHAPDGGWIAHNLVRGCLGHRAEAGAAGAKTVQGPAIGVNSLILALTTRLKKVLLFPAAVRGACRPVGFAPWPSPTGVWLRHSYFSPSSSSCRRFSAAFWRLRASC